MATSQERAYAQDFADFISASPTAFHAAREVARRLDEAGFRAHEQGDHIDVSPGGHYFVRDGAVLAWRIPEGDAQEILTHRHFSLVGSHTDSPGFRLKPLVDSVHGGFTQVNVETYGGLLPNSWLNRDLGIAGRLVALDGTEEFIQTGPLMFIPQLAPHLDRSVRDNLSLNPQKHLHPIFHIGEENLMAALASEVGWEETDVAGADLFAFDTQAPQIISDQFLAAGRQDNLVSVYASLTALLECDPSHVAVMIANDHEEIGSATTTGAAGPLLESTLRRFVYAWGGGEEEFQQILTRSLCVSSDCGHSLNPNYPEYYEPDQVPIMGDGPMLKINANQRYATNGQGQAAWLRAAYSVDAPTQEFVSNNAMPCGSTIGPITATRLGIPTVDVGVPLLSMHSIREVSALSDLYTLASILKGFWSLA